MAIKLVSKIGKYVKYLLYICLLGKIDRDLISYMFFVPKVNDIKTITTLNRRTLQTCKSYSIGVHLQIDVCV